MEIVYIVGALIAGVALGLVVQRIMLKSKADNLIREAESKAESIKKDKMLSLIHI